MEELISSQVQLAIECYSTVLQACLPYIATVMLIHMCVKLIMGAIWDGHLE